MPLHTENPTLKICINLAHMMSAPKEEEDVPSEVEKVSEMSSEQERPASPHGGGKEVSEDTSLVQGSTMLEACDVKYNGSPPTVMQPLLDTIYHDQSEVASEITSKFKSLSQLLVRGTSLTVTI